MKLRDYQEDNKQRLINGWDDGIKNQLSVMPCGSGKTVLFTNIAEEFNDHVCSIVHRQELVSQISLTYAMCGVRHRIIAPRDVERHIIRTHIDTVGANYVSARSKIAVAGVDTLVRRKDLDRWSKRVGLWINDEAHHTLVDNKWGKAIAMFPNALGLGVTATPERTDGKGLGRHAHGVFDRIVEGPDLMWMIDQGYLTPYKIFCPPSDINLNGIKKTRKGDLSLKQHRERETKSHIVGDVVEQFRRIAPGKQGITFASCVKSAIEFSNEFNRAGVDAVMLSGNTKEAERAKANDKFKKRQIMQMTNVDLFGEGYDVPGLDCVSMVRKTESTVLWVQQATRPLRPSYAPGMPLDTAEQRKAAIAQGPKPFAFIIDHVGNVERHAVSRNGRVDLCCRTWSLNGRSKRKTSNGEQLLSITTCPSCAMPYESVKKMCPFCGNMPKPVERSEPKHVDGDLTELDPSRLREMQKEVKKVKGAAKVPYHLQKSPIANRVRKNHHERRQANKELTNAIATWAGFYRRKGQRDSEICRRFAATFGVDILMCQTESAKNQRELTKKINEQSSSLLKGLHNEYQQVGN